MILSQQCVIPIIAAAKLWRYVEARKVVDLLDTQTLYMARADQFDDKLEGNLAGGTVQEIHAELPIYAALAVRTVHQYFRPYMYVSCWRLSDTFEPERFDIYNCGDDRVAIEIQADDLVNSISNDFNFTPGSVQYVDHRTFTAPDGDIFRTIFCKDVAYEHEKEARLVHYSGLPSGLLSHIDLSSIPKYVRAPLQLSRVTYKLHANQGGALELQKHGYVVDSIFS